jgi:hypothetical protein
MASKSKRERMAPQRNLARTFMYWAVAVFAIKLIIIFNIQGGYTEISGRPFFVDGIWPGSDGENYLTGYDALSKEGVFSKAGILNYFPAGYPLVILFLSILGKSWVLTTLSITQSAVFSFAAYFFASQLTRTRLKKYTYLVFILILFNPTLSLISIWIGYESLTASGLLIASGFIIKDFVEKSDKKFIMYLLINSVIFGILTFMQPRLVISGVLINTLWILARKGFKIGPLLLVGSLLVTLFFPATLVYRNHKASGVNTISTNLGVTMNIGAGDKASGTYMNQDFGVPCTLTGSDADRDSQLIKCVLLWYANNPVRSLQLFYNKTLYFWSPWSGTEGRGTMSRNPWLKINPITNIASSPDGYKVVASGIGKTISWLWLLGGIALLIYGFIVLWQSGALEKFIALIAMIAVSTNWLISLISIGDHRFRVPIMGMSIFLQAIALKTLFKGGKTEMVEGPALR